MQDNSTLPTVRLVCAAITKASWVGMLHCLLLLYENAVVAERIRVATLCKKGRVLAFMGEFEK